MNISKPMLAATVEDISKLTYPLLASPKVDGIRCLVLNGQAYTYSRLNECFKVLKNDFIRACLKTLPNGLDGELVTLDSKMDVDTFSIIQSKVMSKRIECKFQYLVFDYLPNQQTHVPFIERYRLLSELRLDFYCNILPQFEVTNEELLTGVEQSLLQQGYEGVMLRKPHAPYKQGRSTLNEGYLMKLKRFQDAEAECVGVEELVREHSSGPTGLLGALVCRYNDVMFNIGTGFTQEQRKNIWLVRKSLEGKQVKFKFQKHGTKDAPRSPVFIAFREDV